MPHLAAVVSIMLLVGLPAAPALASLGTVNTAKVAIGWPDVFFVGVRGSGETETWGSQIQPFVNKLYPLLTSVYDPDHIGPYYLNYPAVPVMDIVGQVQYPGSVSRGRDYLVAALRKEYARCDQSDERIVLAGYSQGAHVIHDALRTLQSYSPDVLTRVASVTLFGDPMWGPDADFFVRGPG